MRSLIRRLPFARRPHSDDAHDPAPSRWRYRVQRLWLTPMFRALIRTGLPVACVGASIVWYLSDTERLEHLVEQATEIRRSLENRPEFLITLVTIDGASDELTVDIQEILPIDLPVSQFALNVHELQAKLEELDPIQSVDVRLKAGGLLSIDVVERTPAIVWRFASGAELLARDGHRVSAVASAALRSDLPQVAGEGAQNHIPEALRLFNAARPLGARVMGLERIGERRWDVVLRGGIRIMLPEDAPRLALDRAIALHAAQDVLNRDISALDFRNGQRPVLRMNQAAHAEWRQIKNMEILVSDDQ
jgi:cell division protein FtsQ